jgi:hypothetical protein
MARSGQKWFEPAVQAVRAVAEPGARVRSGSAGRVGSGMGQDPGQRVGRTSQLTESGESTQRVNRVKRVDSVTCRVGW